MGCRICDAAGDEYTLVSYDTQLLNVKTKGQDNKLVQVDRRELKQDYTVKAEEKEPVTHKTMIDAEGESFKADVWKAIVKTQSLEELRNKSNEDNVTIVEKPTIGVIVDRSFRKGSMILVGFSPHVLVTTRPLKEGSATVYRVASGLECCSDKNAKVVIKKSLEFRKEITVSGVAQNQHTACVNAFWAVPDVTVPSRIASWR